MPNAPNDADPEQPPKKKRKLDQTTTLIPRLVSVAEIIKREFLIDATFREEKLRRLNQVCLQTQHTSFAIADVLQCEETTLANEATSVQSNRGR